MAPSLLRLACLLPAALAHIAVRSEPESEALAVTVDGLDFTDAGETQAATFKGANYACKCYVGESCWPTANKWNSFNNTVDGTLRVHVPPGAVCHNTFNGPFGTLNTYDAAKCAEATAKWGDEPWT